MARWWVRSGEDVFGPVEIGDLTRALRDGRLSPTDLACREEGKEWLLIMAIPDVAEIFAPKRSQPPPQQDPWTEAAWMVGNLDGEILDGPLSLAAVRAAIARRELTGDELLTPVGTTSWRPISDVTAEESRRALLHGDPPSQPRVVGPTLPPARASVAPPLPSRPPSPPRPPPPAEAARPSDGITWWLARGGPIEGPYTTDHLRHGLAIGAIDPQTPACRGDHQQWKPAHSHEELRPKRGSGPPPLPPRRR